MDRRAFVTMSLLTMGISQIPIRAGAKTLKMLTFVPERESPLYLGAKEFVRRVAAFSGGAIQIEIIEYLKLKSSPSNPISLLREGSIDLIHGYIEEFKGTDIPLRQGTRHAWKSDPMTKALFTHIDGQLGIKTLECGADSTPNLIWVNTDKIQSFTDITHSRIRTRAIGSSVIANFRSPIKMSTLEAVNQFRQGGLEAIECTNPCYDFYLELHKNSVAYSLSPWQSDGISVEVAFNSQMWERFSSAEKAALEYGAQRSATLTNGLLTEQNGKVFDYLNASDLKKIELLPAESVAIQRAVARAVVSDDRRAQLSRQYENWVQGTLASV